MNRSSLLLSAVVVFATTAFAADQPNPDAPSTSPGLTTDCTNLVADARKDCEAKRASDMRAKAHEDATKHALDTPEEKALARARKNGTNPQKAVDQVKEQDAAPQTARPKE